MSPVLAKALRILGRLAYVGALAGVFLLAAYLSFNAFVRSGATAAPDLAGLPRQTAIDLLADHGLSARVLEESARFDGAIAAGHVVEQQPRARTLVKRGSTVQLVLSLGPQKTQVPSLRGQSLQSAQVALANSGLALGRTLRVYEPTLEPGTVVEQAPATGEVVPPGATVDALLSLGGSAERYIMPDLVYRDYETVRRFFENRKFRLGSVKFETYEGARDGAILRQFPLAGHPLTRREAISLVVATPPAAATEEDL
ncbi:MAG: PASTA domain-containing protein [Acidobacteriota bacterium]